MTRPKGIIETVPRRPRAGPRRLHVLTPEMGAGILRLRAALKVAQRERAAFLQRISRIPIPSGGTRPAVFSERQTVELRAIQDCISEALRVLMGFQKAMRATPGRWIRSPYVPLDLDDQCEGTQRKLAARVKQLEAENTRLRQLVAIGRRLGRDIPGWTD